MGEIYWQGADSDIKEKWKWTSFVISFLLYYFYSTYIFLFYISIYLSIDAFYHVRFHIVDLRCVLISPVLLCFHPDPHLIKSLLNSTTHLVPIFPHVLSVVSQTLLVTLFMSIFITCPAILGHLGLTVYLFIYNRLPLIMFLFSVELTIYFLVISFFMYNISLSLYLYRSESVYLCLSFWGLHSISYLKN